MELTKYFGMDILDALASLRRDEEVVEYDKVEADEFVQVPERGFYLQSKNGSGKISNFRLFFHPYDGFFPSEGALRGKFSSVTTLKDMEALLGPSTKNIRSIKIPGAPATLPGKKFADDGYVVSAFTEDGEHITFLHVKTDLA